MRIDRHIYGSICGYQTLAKSDGITAADCRVLEKLSVGSSANSSLLAALGRCPSYIVLPLGDRRAVTQISTAGPDDQGRATLLHVTLAVAQSDWDRALRADVLALIRRKDLWRWDGQPTLQSFEVAAGGAARTAVSPVTADKLLSLLSLVEHSVGSGKGLLVRERDLSLDEFCLLEMLLPPSARATVTLAYRAFAAGLPASLVCLAKEAGGVPSTGLYHPGQPVDLSPYAQAVAQAGLKLGHIPEGFISSYRGFGASARTHASATLGEAVPMEPAAQAIVERIPPKMLAALMAVSILFAAFTGATVWLMAKRAAKKAIDEQIALVREHGEELAKSKDMVKKAQEEREADHRKDEERTNELQGQLDQLVGKSEELIAALKKVESEKLKILADMCDLPLPVFASGQRKQILTTCRNISASFPDGFEGKADANDAIAKLENQQRDVNALENSLTSGVTPPLDPSAAKQKMADLLGGRKIERLEFERLQGFVEQLLDRPTPASPGVATAPATSRAQDAQTTVGTAPREELLKLLGSYVDDLNRVEVGRRTSLDKSLLERLKKAANALKDGHQEVKALGDADEYLLKWQDAEGFTLKAPQDIDRARGLVRNIRTTLGGLQ